MTAIQRTSLLICITLLVLFASAGIVVKWPTIEQWYEAVFDKPEPQLEFKDIGTDPFNYDPPLASNVVELHPHYTLKADLLPNEAKLVGTATIEFDNPKTQQIYLYCYPYVWSPMKIKSITHANQPLDYQRRDPVVVLVNQFQNEKRIKLTIEFETPVPRKPSRFGVSDDIWTLTNWYPMLGSLNPQKQWYEPPQPIGYGDPYVYQYADYDVTFGSPAAFQWVTSWGLGEAKLRTEGRKETTYFAKGILNFSLVGSPEYFIETITIEPNLKVHIGSKDRKNIKQIEAIAKSAFTTYTRLQGELPYPHVAIAETGKKTVFAMEYANMAIFSTDMYEKNQVDHWLPHEIAHLWWYNSVGNVEPTYGWIDEGLVESSVYHYKKHRYGAMAANSVIKEYEADYEKLKKNYPYGKLAKHLTQLNNDERYWTWYASGALLYHKLRLQIGDEKYSEFLRRLQRHYHGKLIGPEHLDQTLSQTLRGEAHYFVPNSQKLNKDPFYPVTVEYYMDLILNGISYYPTVPARLTNGTVYIPIRDVMEKLGYKVTADSKQGTIHLEKGTSEITLIEKSNQFIINQHQRQLTKPLLELKDKIIAPLELFQFLFKDQIAYDPAGKTVKISVGR